MTYKTANELGIEQWELEGLVATKSILGLTKKLPDKYANVVHDGLYFDISHGANTALSEYDQQSNVWQEYKCGTVACIGGWTYLLAHGMSKTADADEYVIDELFSDALHDLFYPTFIGWHLITPQIAINAIENFLTTGEVDWIKASAGLIETNQNENSQ